MIQISSIILYILCTNTIILFSRVGYVPNDMMSGVFMAVSLDAHEVDEVHPKNKQLVASRLSYAAMNVAYGYREYPLGGPFPIESVLRSDGRVVIKFNQVRPNGIRKRDEV